MSAINSRVIIIIIIYYCFYALLHTSKFNKLECECSASIDHVARV